MSCPDCEGSGLSLLLVAIGFALLCFIPQCSPVVALYAHEVVKKCERNLPRTQECRITAEPITEETAKIHAPPT